MADLSLCLATIVALVIISLTHWLYRWWYPKSNGKLPPGSMGWPLIGETFAFLSTKPTSAVTDMFPFIKERKKRYGAIFRTSLLGQPTIVSTDPVFNYFVLRKHELFVSGYPYSFRKLVGPQNGFVDGPVHYKYLKTMVLRLFGPENMKKILHEVQAAVNKELLMWSNQGAVDLKDAFANMIFNLTSHKLISHDPKKCSERLVESFGSLFNGFISIPLDIPGTTFHKCLQARKRITRMLQNMLRQRRKVPREEKVDLFDYIIEELSRKGTMLTDAIAVDFIYALLFASFETTSVALTLAMKFLTDHPSVLKTLTEEHEAILRNRKNVKSGTLSWTEYKSMTFTFQGVEINNANRNFMPFGAGTRLCLGADFAKVQMAVFLHCLLTNYEWQSIETACAAQSHGSKSPCRCHAKFYRKMAAATEAKA